MSLVDKHPDERSSLAISMGAAFFGSSGDYL